MHTVTGKGTDSGGAYLQVSPGDPRFQTLVGMVANWKANTDNNLNQRLKTTSPGHNHANDGTDMGSTINMDNYMAGDFNGDGRRDIPVWPPEVAPPANSAPVANAGPDQPSVIAGGSGSATVTLNGSGSSDSDGSIVSYVWKEGTSQLASGTAATVQVSLAVGTHTVTLTVTDDDGATAADTALVTVSYRDLLIDAAVDWDWVYQNTQTTTEDRHLSVVTVSLTQEALTGESYTVEFTENGGALANFALQAAGGNHYHIVGGRVGASTPNPGPSPLGAYTIGVKYTGQTTGRVATDALQQTLRLLGDIDGDGDVDGDDKAQMNRRMNSLSSSYPDRAFNLTGDLDGLGNPSVDGDDKALMNRLLNSLSVQ
jgi:hypothetical protein